MGNDLYLVPLLPEELLSGYRGRLRFLNDISRHDRVALAFANVLQRAQWGDANEQGIVQFAAQVNQLTVRDVVMQHTLWPFNNALGRPTLTAEIQDIVQDRPGRTAVMRCARRDAWFCMDCVQEDLAFWHTSYWRRSHQLAGAFWCDKHLTGLHRVNRGAIDQGPPDHHLREAIPPEGSWVNELKHNPVVRAFFELCVEILAGGLTFDRASQVDRIGRLLGQGCPEWSRDEICAILSNEARDRVPREWLEEVFPQTDWTADGTIRLIFEVMSVRSRNGTAALLLVAVLAYGTLERVLAEVSNAPFEQNAAEASVNSHDAMRFQNPVRARRIRS